MSQAQFWLYSEGDDKYVTQQQQEEKKKKLLQLLKEVIQQLIAEAVDHKEQISIQNPAAFKLCQLIELILSNGLREKFGELPTFWKLIEHPKYLRELDIPEIDLKRLDILKCRIWIRYALNKKRIGTYIGEAISNAALVNQWYHEWALIRVLDQSTVAVHLLLSLETIDFKLSLHNIEAHPDEELLDLKKKPLARSSTVKKKRSKLVSIENSGEAVTESSPHSERSAVSDALSEASELSRGNEELDALRAQHRALTEQHQALVEQLRVHELRASEFTEREASLQQQMRAFTERELESNSDMTRREQELTRVTADVNQRTAELTSREEQLTARLQEIEQRERALTLRVEELTAREHVTAQRSDELETRAQELTRREGGLTLRAEDMTRRDRDLVSRAEDLTGREQELVRKLEEISRRELEVIERGNDVNLKIADISAREQQVTRKQEELQTREHVIEQREEELQTRDQHVTKLTAEIDERSQRLQKSEEELQTRDKHVTEQQSAINLRAAEIEQKTRDLEALQQQCTVRDAELNSRAAELQSFEERVTRERGELNQSLQQFNEQQSALTRDREALESRAQELKTLNEELTRVKLEQEHQRRLTSDTQSSQEQQLQELIAKIAQTEQQLGTERKEFETQLARDRESAKIALSEARDREQRANEQIQALVERESALQARVESSTRDHDESRVSLLSQLSTLQSEYKCLQTLHDDTTRQLSHVSDQAGQADTAVTRVKELEQSHVTLTAQLKTAEDSKNQLSDELNALQLELTRVKQESELHARDLATVREELAMTRSTRDDATARDSTLQQTIDSQQHQITQLNEQVQRLNEQHHAVISERDTALTRVTELEQSLEHASQQRTTVEQQVTALTAELTGVKEQLATLQSELDSTTQSRDESRAALDQSRDEQNALTAEISTLRAQLAEQQQQQSDTVSRDVELLRAQNTLLQDRVTLLVHNEEALTRSHETVTQLRGELQSRDAEIARLNEEVAQLRAQLTDRDQTVLDETEQDEKDRAISADSSLSQTPLDQSPLSLSASVSQGHNTPPLDSPLDSPARTLVAPVTANKYDKVASHNLVLYDDYTPDATPRALLQSFSSARDSDSEEEDDDIILAPNDVTIKQLIKRKDNEADPREVTERLKTMNTVKTQWQPPKKQMHYYPHDKLAKSVVLTQQGYLCAGCGKQLLMRTGDVAKSVRYCEYSGKYFCTTCHKNDKYVIPARIIFDWDFKTYPISAFYKQFLKEMAREPLIDIQALNPQLYAQVAEFKYIRVARRQLFYLKDFIFTCRDKDKLLDESISTRIHLVDSRYYSLQDLRDIQSGKLHLDLKAVLLKWVSHVARCDLCKVKGSYCEFCKGKDILYPFQLRSVIICRHCKALAHRACYREDQCPKCMRIQKRLSSSGNNNTNSNNNNTNVNRHSNNKS